MNSKAATPGMVFFCPEYNILSVITDGELITGLKDELEIDLLITRSLADEIPICLITDWILLGEL